MWKVYSIYLSFIYIDTLTEASSLYQQLADRHCGEVIYRCCIQSLASLCPLYGLFGLQAEQAQIAYYVCSASLPSMKPKDAQKKTVDSIFSSKNLAAIEALVVLCKGKGKGLETCWKLVASTVEVINEYIPSKDNENNYVWNNHWLWKIAFSKFSYCLCRIWDYWRTIRWFNRLCMQIWRWSM